MYDLWLQNSLYFLRKALYVIWILVIKLMFFQVPENTYSSTADRQPNVSVEMAYHTKPTSLSQQKFNFNLYFSVFMLQRTHLSI
jgi:hypothetical protein